MYTSGTTGRPKGALLPHRGLVACCLVQSDRWYDFEPLRTLCDLPINHVGCLGDLCCSTLAAGGALYFMERLDAGGLLRAIERERISFWGTVPTMLLLATRAPEWSDADLSSLRRIVWSGARASEEPVLELSRLGVPLAISYGMTETIGSVTYADDGDAPKLLAATIGRPDPRFDVRVVGPDGTDGTGCAPGEEGELVVAGDCLMLGYLGRPDAFKSGGYNVFCREVELALERHPAISAAAVVGVPDELGPAPVRVTFFTT